MKKTMHFLKGKSSRHNNNGVDEDHPFGYNEFLNYLARHNIPRLDDRLPPDASPNRDCYSHPIYSVLTIDWQEILHRTEYRAHTKLLSRSRSTFGVGFVYRCEFPEFNSVGAAKFLDLRNPSVEDEFMAEITALHNAKHQNVIKLIGKSFGRKELALVYEFMPRGSLHHHIIRTLNPAPGLKRDTMVLDWETRMQIAVGVAKALRYVHNELKVIHRDVKLGNVLLDQDFVPKLSDFGAAVKIMVGEDGREINREIFPNKGSPGCMAPETEQRGNVSTKSDVYSYGYLLYQLFTAKECSADWMRDNCRGPDIKLKSVMDAALCNGYTIFGLNSIFETASMCTDPEANARPSMEQVVNMVRQAAAFVPPVLSGLSKCRSY